MYCAIGFFAVVLFSLKATLFFIWALYIHVYGALFLSKRLKSYGQWAVVTGATRGCGVEYCKQLAELGLNIILIARNEKLIKQMTNDLESKYKIKTAFAVTDFGDISDKSIATVKKVLQGKDIGILVNNAGLMYEHPELFHHIEPQLLQDMIKVNNIWPQALAHHVLVEHMLPKNRGLIVFMSSIVDELQSPMLAAYGATKAYNTYLVKCLSTEYQNTGVKFQVLSPSYIATDMTKYHEKINTPSLISPSGETYVKHAIRTFGLTLQTSGYFPHDFQRELSSYLPQIIYRSVNLKVQEHVKRTKRS